MFCPKLNLSTVLSEQDLESLQEFFKKSFLYCMHIDGNRTGILPLFLENQVVGVFCLFVYVFQVKLHRDTLGNWRIPHFYTSAVVDKVYTQKHCTI